jgi:hypothetical protein
VVDRLIDLYWELQASEEGIGLEEFVARAAAGEYGKATGEDLREFLRAVEERLVRRLERERADAHATATTEELVDETRAWIEDLISRFCD